MDGQWEIGESQVSDFEYKFYLFKSNSGWSLLKIFVVDDNPEGFFNYLKGGDKGLQTCYVDGVECLYRDEIHTGELYDDRTSNHRRFVYTFTEDYGYYIEVKSNAEGGETAMDEFNALCDAVASMYLNDGSDNSGVESSVANALNDNNKVTADMEKDNSTVVIVAIVVGGVVVLGLGLGAMIIFGKKKK
jgi:hypothetical protein